MLKSWEERGEGREERGERREERGERKKEREGRREERGEKNEECSVTRFVTWSLSRSSPVLWSQYFIDRKYLSFL
jgi:hypothetical protein